MSEDKIKGHNYAKIDSDSESIFKEIKEDKNDKSYINLFHICLCVRVFHVFVSNMTHFIIPPRGLIFYTIYSILYIFREATHINKRTWCTIAAKWIYVCRKNNLV